MAKPCTRYSFAPVSKNELAGNTLETPIKGNNISTPILATSWASILIFTFTLGPLGMYTDMDLQKTTKLALELFIIS